MGLPTDLVTFFDPMRQAGQDVPSTLQPHSLGDFFGVHNYDYRLMWEAASICRRLVDAGVLTAAGTGKGSPPLSECYWANSVRPEKVTSPLFEFLAYGFPAIHQHFSPAVLAIILEKENGDADIGTGFLLNNRMIATARHCIENMPSIIIKGWSPQVASIAAIYAYEDPKVDLAILSFSSDPLPGTPGFSVGTPSILDNVLTMGYPQIPGFDAPLIAETSQIAAVIKSSIGVVVSLAQSYLDSQDYLLLSARVKGGNSGGPVISRKGEVVGIVTHFPAEEHGRPDLLGYAAALPSIVITDLLNEVAQESTLVAHFNFWGTDTGFRTKQ